MSAKDHQFMLSRRGLFASGAIPLAGGDLERSDFDFWSAEHERMCTLLDLTPEAEEDARNLLLDRGYELELMIVNTPSSTPSAVRAKAKILHWLMTMEQHEGAPAMRDIHDFVMRITLAR